MYSKEEASRIRQSFWTSFGQYVSPILSEEGTKLNWINYKTGLKDVYFRMNVDQKKAVISIEINHPDPGLQELFFQQFEELKIYLHSVLEEEWKWELHVPNEHGRIISKISKELTNVSVFKIEDWPEIISFFKPRIIALDHFWSDAKYNFDALK
jgi:hypothetical protein